MGRWHAWRRHGRIAIEAQLAAAAGPLTAAAMRKLCQIRNATLPTALTDLVAAGRVRKDTTGYVIAR